MCIGIVYSNVYKYCIAYSNIVLHIVTVSQVALVVNNLPAMQETQVQSLGEEDPTEEEMATNSRILACGIPWTVEPDDLQTMESPRIGHD